MYLKKRKNGPLLIGGVVLASIITTQKTKMEQHKEEKRLWKKGKRRTEGKEQEEQARTQFGSGPKHKFV